MTESYQVLMSWECRAVIHGTVPSICEIRNPAGAPRCICGAERPTAKKEENRMKIFHTQAKPDAQTEDRRAVGWLRGIMVCHVVFIVLTLIYLVWGADSGALNGPLRFALFFLLGSTSPLVPFLWWRDRINLKDQRDILVRQNTTRQRSSHS